MAANKCCCCRLLSCFACFSDKKTAQPHSSEFAPSSLNANANASPAAALTVKSSHVMSSTPAAVSGCDSQLSSPSAYSSSQANASKDVLVRPNDSQSVNQSAVPSSFQPTVTSSTFPASSQTIVFPPAHPVDQKGFQIGSSSTPSSSTVPKESDYAKKIQDAADAVDIDDVDADLNDLINYISQLLDFIKEKKTGNKPSIPKPSIPKPSLPKAAKDLWRSTNLKKLKEVLSDGMNVVKDVCPDAKTIAQDCLKVMGAAHMATTGLLVVANILERYEAISTNKEACLSLLKEMNILARHVKELQKRPELKEQMGDSIGDATALIVEASIACCTQIDGSKFSKFFSTTVDGEELDKFKTRLTETDTHMQRQINLCIFDAIVRPRKPRELQYPIYPKDTVGIEDPLKEVIERLEWSSDKNALAVILHGFGGMGKTTLADAVFARLFDANLPGCKYSYIRLFENIATNPDIKKLQNCILRDLMGDEPKEIRSYEQGQQQIEHMLEKEVAFIYIDNVLLPDKVEQGRDALKQLLPANMGNARKLRLLITARDEDAASVGMCKERRLKVEFYPIEILPDTQAIKLVKQKLEGNEEQIGPNEMYDIVRICGGIPKLLTVVAGFISSAKNKQEAQEKYRIVMSEKKKNWKGQIGKDIACYVFAYENLDEDLRDPFLDICSFFQGWDWEKISNIVGDFELNSLEKRSLVTKDVKSMTARVHDVILAIGLDKKGEGFRFTSASEIQKFLDKKNKDKDFEKIKGIWSSDNRVPFCIPASKLDLMYRSLRVLILGNSTGVEGKCKEIFEELVIFSAGVSHLPFEVSELKEFKKLSHLCYKPEDLQNLSQMPPNLRHIEFDLNSPAFQISSNCIPQLSNLRVLKLSNAKFESLPQELGDLGNGGLQKLTILNCHNLKELPGSISRLGSLRELTVRCEGLTQLPEDVGSLNSLQYLSLGACSSLEALPRSLGNLTSLQDLDLNWCRSLKALPTSFGKLTSLQKLSLDFCESLEALPSSFEELSSLSKLDLQDCPKITDLPYGFGKLTSLVELHLGCRKLSSIPESIGQLKLLDTIAFDWVRDLKELPDGFCNLSSLTQLDMYDGRHLEKLPDRFGELTSLKTVSLSGCGRLKKLPDRFGELTSLKTVFLIGCGSLKKLPESFSQLKSLECLQLSNCWTLEELCVCFKGLSSLRELSLPGCTLLKKLPEDFHCLSSLEVLDLTNCRTLEGKCMQSMVNMKKLQILHIKGSTLLEERWEGIRRECDQSWPCRVYTGQSNMESISKQLQSEFDSILTNGRGEPFHISGLPLNTPLLVMFDGQENSNVIHLRIIAEAIDDIQTNFEMVYFGNRFNELPKKVVDRILGHAPAYRNVELLFRKVFPLAPGYKTDFGWEDHVFGFQMTAKIVSDKEGDNYLSCWELLSEESVEEFVVKKCGRYLKLKQLVERGGESNKELLRELFASGEEEESLGFLKKGAPMKVGLDQMEGKMILLDIRPANIGYDIPLKYLVEMYGAEKQRFNFEIITIPVMQENTSIDVSEKFSSEVPWLVLQNPWQLTNAVKYFLVEGCESRPESYDSYDTYDSHHPWDRWYPQRMRIIESNGTIAAVEPTAVLPMVNTWGIDAYPFTEEKRREFIEKEVKEMKAMSHLMFLFHHLESVSQQVKEAMRQPKMIWLYLSNEGEVPNTIKNVLMELGDSIYIIYVPYPKFDKKQEDPYVNFTHVPLRYFPLEESKMLPLQMQGMLNLSRDEVMRFWARRFSLKGINHQDQQFQEMLDKGMSIVIMDKDGNLITNEGQKIVKLLSKHPPDDKAKELVQQFIEGANQWFVLQQLLWFENVDSESSLSGSHSPVLERLLEFEDVDSEGLSELEEFEDVAKAQ